MSWTYEQSTGRLLWPSGEQLAVGYSGHGEGVNNPSLESVENVGPLPCGWYGLGTPHDSATHGPFFIPLIPDPSNQMFGRSAFGIHGDEIKHAGERLASNGCIIVGPFTRHTMWQSTDHRLQVVPGIAT